MKGSQTRKRYVLIQSDTGNSLQSVLRNVYEKFGCKTKFVSGNRGVFLTDQFHKESVCNYLQSTFSSTVILTVSGTIRKCKEIMKGLDST